MKKLKSIIHFYPGPSDSNIKTANLIIIIIIIIIISYKKKARSNNSGAFGLYLCKPLQYTIYSTSLLQPLCYEMTHHKNVSSFPLTLSFQNMFHANKHLVSYGQEEYKSLCLILFSGFNQNWKLPIWNLIKIHSAVLELLQTARQDNP
jgi:hypothetical protein